MHVLRGDVHVLQSKEPGGRFCQSIACWLTCWSGLRTPSGHARFSASCPEYKFIWQYPGVMAHRLLKSVTKGLLCQPAPHPLAHTFSTEDVSGATGSFCALNCKLFQAGLLLKQFSPSHNPNAFIYFSRIHRRVGHSKRHLKQSRHDVLHAEKFAHNQGWQREQSKIYEGLLQ